MTARNRMAIAAPLLFVALLGASPAKPGPAYDVVLKGGTIYDGSGAKGVTGDLAITGGRIAYVGPHAPGTARETIDARGLAVAPGFINMLSWADESLIADGRGLSDISQGVTLELFGEGESPGPLTPAMRAERLEQQPWGAYPVEWTTLGEHLDWLAHRGVAPNIGSFVGAQTVRVNVLGKDDVDPTPAQTLHMRALVAQAMREGAMGVGSSLIYAPGSYAETPELIALVDEVARCDGMYISHIRSQTDRLLESIDELIAIARATGARAEIYHFKQAGRENWPKIDAAIARVESARRAGLRITADIYPYTMAGSGLDASIPTWVQAGGIPAMIQRLRDPAVRARVVAEMRAGQGKDWENLTYASGGAQGVVASNFRSASLQPLVGKSIAEIARSRGTSPEDTILDLVIADGSRVGVLYHTMTEPNVARGVARSWMSFGSDAEAAAPEPPFLKGGTHPRAYGTFARVIARYVRDEHRMTLAEAIRRMTSLPADNLKLHDRGRLKAGFHADVAVFDPRTFQDHATEAQPRQLATGMRLVFVNGRAVLRDGKPTGERPGQVVRGPGWSGWPGGGACKK